MGRNHVRKRRRQEEIPQFWRGGWRHRQQTGIDLNFGYSPKVFGDGDDAKVIDLMGNLTFGPEIGRGSTSARPYGLVGVGLLRTGSTNNFGFNAGAGVFAFLTDRLGFRGEVRYFRTLNGATAGDFHFMRAQLGVMLR